MTVTLCSRRTGRLSTSDRTKSILTRSWKMLATSLSFWTRRSTNGNETEPRVGLASPAVKNCLPLACPLTSTLGPRR